MEAAVRVEKDRLAEAHSELDRVQEKRDAERKENKKLNTEIMSLKVRERELINK